MQINKQIVQKHTYTETYQESQLMGGLQVAYLLTKRGQVVKLETGNRAENAVISSTTFPFTTSQTRT